MSDLEIGGHSVKPGRKADIEIPVARLPAGGWVSMPIKVLHGRKEGPRVWLSAAIHGDEVNGVEIIDGVLAAVGHPRSLAGTIVAVPVVNVFGFFNQSRYLPDGRDLNRAFPGSRRGSLASRLARLFMDNIVVDSAVGIDFHTATAHRVNVPQIRADLSDPQTRKLAEVFGARASIHSKARDGSLRDAAAHAESPVLLFEGGQAQRFENQVIEAGVAGALRVLAHLGMIAPPEGRPPQTAFFDRSSWVRARKAGLLRTDVSPGDMVDKGATLGRIVEVGGVKPAVVKAPIGGMVIGLNQNPIVTQGDALFHIARPEQP